jgi:hypothetical protein
MMLRILSIATALLLLARLDPAQAAPASVQQNLPQPVADWLKQAKDDCPAGFQAQNAIESVSLTGDGRPGFIANPHRLSCAGEPHLYGGDGPASIELFVTLPSGAVVHTGGVLALGYRIEDAPGGGAPIVAFTTHESSERAGSIDDYRWDGRNFALLNRQSMAQPPVGGPDSEYER